MIITIPKWSLETGNISHKKTSWIITSDIDGNNILEEVIASDTFINAYETNLIIPDGEIYYVKALRHLYDVNDVEIENNSWIGPIPIINENNNEYFKPDLYIKEPYIKDIKYDIGQYLKIYLTPVESNVPYKHTMLFIETDKFEPLLLKTIDITQSSITDEENCLVVDSSELNFVDLNTIYIHIIHIGVNSIISNPIHEYVTIKRAFYKVASNTVDVDYYNPEPIIIDSTTDEPVELLYAKLQNILHQDLEICEVDNNKIIIPDVLEANKSYIVVFEIKYMDIDGSMSTSKDSFILTTRKKEEIFNLLPNRKYSNIFKNIGVLVTGNDNDNDIVGNDIKLNTEEFYTNVIPLKDTSNDGYLGLFLYDKVNNNFIRYKENSWTLGESATIRLLKKDYGYIQTELNNKAYIRFFVYSPIDDSMIAIVENPVFDSGIKVSDGMNRILLNLDTGMFIVGKDIDNDKLIIKEITISDNFVDNNAITRFEKEFSSDITEFYSCEYGLNNILIYPYNTTSNLYDKFYLYNPILNEITELLDIPEEFIGSKLYMVRLQNGDILGIDIDTNDNLNYFILDIVNETIDTYIVNLGNDSTINNIFKLKDGTIIVVLNTVNDDGISMRNVWKFY